MARLLSGILYAVIAAVLLGAAERQWEEGVWVETTIERPRVVFGTQTRDPNSSLPRTAPSRETRNFVVDTKKYRLELRQDATGDTPRVDAVVGSAVMIAVEKKDVYIKDVSGKEHKVRLQKQSPLPATATPFAPARD